MSERFAAVVQAAPTGDGAVVLESVQSVIAYHVDLIGKLPKGGPAPLYTVEGLQALGDDLTARAEMGKAKYGTYLRTNNGRSAIVDMYQEILDAIMYAQQARLEGDEAAGMYVELLINIGQRLAAELNKRAA